MEVATEDYLHDVFVSYPRGGNVEPWVRKHLVPRLKQALQENLGRQAVFIDAESMDTGVSWPAALQHALSRSRVMLAIWSRQYFVKAWCLAELDSMLERHQMLNVGTVGEPHLLVHAIVAQDCHSVPARYEHLQRNDAFKNFVFDFADTDWTFFRQFQTSVCDLAEHLSATVEQVPPWRPDFPFTRPDGQAPPEPRVPRF